MNKKQQNQKTENRTNGTNHTVFRSTCKISLRYLNKYDEI